MPDIITLEDYKQAKGIFDDFNDAQLLALIDMACGFIEDYCSRVFGKGIFTERHEGVMDAQGRFFFKVDNPTLDEVQSISVRYINTEVALSVDVSKLAVFSKGGYAYYYGLLNPSIGVIRPEYRENFYYDIVYSGGMAVPPAVKLAAINIVADTFAAMNANMVASGQQTLNPILSKIKIGDYEEWYDTQNSAFNKLHNADTGIVLTQTVKDLLKHYVKQGQSW
jgi:hypothetical protein